MSDVLIITLRPKKLGNTAVDKVQVLIQKVTKSQWTHSQMVIDGVMYESAWPFFKKTENYQPNPSEYCKVHRFVEPWTEWEKTKAKAWWMYHLIRNTGYGLLKLALYLAGARTKPFWNKLGWCPMSVDRIWGDFCSAAVDNACKFAGRDLLPGTEEFTAPSDILQSKLLKEI